METDPLRRHVGSRVRGNGWQDDNSCSEEEGLEVCHSGENGDCKFEKANIGGKSNIRRAIIK